MTKVGLIWFILLNLIIYPASAQKVKYKDIYTLLSTKQYEQAEPFLKNYIKANDNNPNAFLYMGIVFQEKALKNDLLKQTRYLLLNIDSAIFFYHRALKTIDEKEIKRNKEYYQNYNRRDMRTGEFGVKLSDIQFDIEKKIEGLRERIDRVKMVQYYFLLSDSLYKKCNVLFKTIQEEYPGQKELLLRGDEASVSKLKGLAVRFDSTLKAFENYRSSLQLLGSTTYNQVINLQDIVNFTSDGRSLADFYQNDLQVWDYKKFASQAAEVIEKEIFPMREHLVAYDIEIGKLRDKLSKDSVSVRSDLTKLIDKLLYAQLKKIDPDPLPMHVFTMKLADLEYRSLQLENKAYKDSLDLHWRLRAAQQEMTHVLKLDSVAGKLNTLDMDEAARNYHYFVTNTYESSSVLKSYVKALKDFAERDIRKLEEKLKSYSQALRWLVVNNDSVPLFTDELDNIRFKPLLINDEKYTCGIVYKDSLNPSGYFYSITPSRIPGIRAEFPLDKASFKLSRFNVAKALSIDHNSQIYFLVIYSGLKTKDKYAVTVSKIYHSDGLAWAVNSSLTFIPKELSYKPDTGELLIKADELTSTFDKNGRLLK